MGVLAYLDLEGCGSVPEQYTRFVVPYGATEEIYFQEYFVSRKSKTYFIYDWWSLLS